MKLWIDDIRPAPEGWVWAKSSYEALDYFLEEMVIDEISFDHDLGGKDDAYLVAMFIEQQAAHGLIGPMIWHVHSANPVGRARIEAAMKNADRYWGLARDSMENCQM